MHHVVYFTLLLLNIVVDCDAQDSLVKFKQSAPMMGTTFTITVYGNSNQQCQRAVSQAYARIDELNTIFSDYLEDSECSQLSAHAENRISVSDDLWYLLRLSKKISRQSKGAFDVSIGPLTKLWRRAIRQQEIPDSAKLHQAQGLVNYRWIKLFNGKQQVKLKKKGMKLDFGAIAKGYAIDEAYKELLKNGIRVALVDGGGDLFIGDAPPRASWKIKDHQMKLLTAKTQIGVASSGDTFQNLYWDGSNYSHIINPKSGSGLKDSKIITVTAENATIADALASTISIVHQKHRSKLLRKYQAEIIE